VVPLLDTIRRNNTVNGDSRLDLGGLNLGFQRIKQIIVFTVFDNFRHLSPPVLIVPTVSSILIEIKAAVSVNRELLQLYWFIAEQIVQKQQTARWGDGLIKQVSQDLQQEFPEIKGGKFAIINLSIHFHLCQIIQYPLI
jgi:hypothetical protein